ncbi:MAG: helicase HerA-like domain-containing protein [Chthoniobacter sp.]
MPEPFLLAKGASDLLFSPRMGNRHGLIAGATGTGKTVTLQTLAENFSALGVPVFLTDIKGGLERPRQGGHRHAEDCRTPSGTRHHRPRPTPGIRSLSGISLASRVTPSARRSARWVPLLLARVLNLNDTQEGVLQLLFKVADDHGLLLLDLEDLREMLKFIAENASQFTVEYGNISAASVGTIQRALLQLDQQGGAKFFGEPALNLDDFIQTTHRWPGCHQHPRRRPAHAEPPHLRDPRCSGCSANSSNGCRKSATWEKPKLVFFFDEAHLLFTDLPKEIEDKIEQVVRLIRSKGVGVYFITQNPIDIPARILGQLGNRVQHALRAFSTARSKGGAKRRGNLSAESAAQRRGQLNVAATITQLAVGEALISLLDEAGTPAMVERAWIVPPHGQIGPSPRPSVTRSSSNPCSTALTRMPWIGKAPRKNCRRARRRGSAPPPRRPPLRTSHAPSRALLPPARPPLPAVVSWAPSALSFSAAPGRAAASAKDCSKW